MKRRRPNDSSADYLAKLLHLLERRGGLVVCSLKDLTAFWPSGPSTERMPAGVSDEGGIVEAKEEFAYKRLAEQDKPAEAPVLDCLSIPLEQFKALIRDGREAAVAHAAVNRLLEVKAQSAVKVYAKLSRSQPTSEASWHQGHKPGDNFEGVLLSWSPIIYKPEGCEHPLSKVVLDWESNGFFRCGGCGERGLKPTRFERA